MSVLVTCNRCARQLRVQQQHLGRAVRCPACMQVIHTAAPPPTADQIAAATASAWQSSRLSGHGELPRWPVAVWAPPALGAGLCLVLMLVAAITSVPKDEPMTLTAQAETGAAQTQRQPASLDNAQKLAQTPPPSASAQAHAAGDPRPRVVESIEMAAGVSPADEPAGPTARAQRRQRRQRSPPPAEDSNELARQEGLVGGWHVTTDPPSQPVVYAQQPPIRLPIPGKKGTGAVIYPDVASPIVAVGNVAPRREAWEVWDLSTMTRLNKIKGRIPSNTAAISPDGAYLAAKTGRDRMVLIWDLKKDEALSHFETGPFDRMLAFSASDRLVAGNNGTLLVWRLPQMDVQCEIKMPGFIKPETIAFSPGGRYLAVASDGIDVLDLQSGLPAGEIRYPDLGHARCLAFSPDGQELAGLFQNFDERRVVCWDMASGSMLNQTRLGPEVINVHLLGEYQGRALEWFPNRQRWLVYGHLIVERASGKVAWRLPATEGVIPAGPRVVLDDARLMMVSGPVDARVLAAYDLPAELASQ